MDGRRSLPDFPAPDADLAATVGLLDATELAGASDVDVVAAIAGWQQVIDAASAAQAAAISELTKRRPVSRDGVADEVALALTCTRYRATHLIGRAHGLDAFAVLRDALAGGTLDAAKVDLLLDEVACLPDDDADAVLRDVLAGADGLTTTHLRRLVRRQVLATRPEVARTRAAKARRERCVTLQHGPDAMAWVHAYLPAADAVAMFGVVDALAWAQRAADEERTIDQRRADALSGLFGGILATGALPDGTALPAPQGHRVGVQVAVGATTLLGLDDLPGELVGYGPIPAAMARDLARDGTWRRVLTDPAGHVLHVDDHTHPAGAVARERVGERRTADPGAWERAGDRRTRRAERGQRQPGIPPRCAAPPVRAGPRPGVRLRRLQRARMALRPRPCGAVRRRPSRGGSHLRAQPPAALPPTSPAQDPRGLVGHPRSGHRVHVHDEPHRANLPSPVPDPAGDRAGRAALDRVALDRVALDRVATHAPTGTRRGRRAAVLRRPRIGYRA